MNYKIPLFYPYIPETVVPALTETLKTKWIGQGPKVEEFEKAIGEKFGLKFPLMTNSGTSALELVYEILDLGPGDSVVAPVLTCTATNIPLLRRGVNIIFADVDPDSLVMTNETVRKVLCPGVKAIIGTSLGGIKCDLTGFDIPVVIDASQAIGHNNGDFIVYSFQAIKHFTTADGGLLNCPTEYYYRKAKKLRWFGIDRESKARNDWQAYKDREMTFDIELPGFKYQPTDIDATMGLCGLAEYDNIISYREDIFNYYKQELDGFHDIKMVDGKDNVYWLATLLVNNRDVFAKRLSEAGIETNLVQLRNDIFSIFGGKRISDLKNMNMIEDSYISIPIHMKMTMDDTKYVVETIKKIYE